MGELRGPRGGVLVGLKFERGRIGNFGELNYKDALLSCGRCADLGTLLN